MGREQAYHGILAECARELGVKTDAGQIAHLLAERQAALVSLRIMCREAGLDVEIDSKDRIADILDKVIPRAIERMKR